MENDLKTAVVCIAKDEDAYIREWAEWHRRIGYDRIFVYCNDWKAPELPEYVNSVDFPGKAAQTAAYNDFVLKYSGDFDWATFIDVDEFAYPGKYGDVKSMFADFDGFRAMAMNWKLFGSSGMTRRRDAPVIKRFVMSQKGLNRHVKTSVNFRLCRRTGADRLLGFYNPHFVNLAANNDFAVRADKKKFVLGPWTDWADGETEEGLPYIAHYAVKSKEEFMERRSRERADTGAVREDLRKFLEEIDRNEVRNNDLAERIRVYAKES